MNLDTGISISADVSKVREPRRITILLNLAAWLRAYNDAPTAAKHALSLIDPDERRFAFSKALPLWVAPQPVEAALWMSNVEPSPERDLFAASIATRPGASQHPNASVLWAENILE